MMTSSRALGTIAIMSNDPYAALAELAGGFIHEIKNHLSTLGLNLQLLAEDFQEPQNQRERRALGRVQKLQTECQRLVGVSNDFLRFARIKELKLEPTNLGKMRAGDHRFLHAHAPRRPTSTSRLFCPPICRPCCSIASCFEQALLNLMLNAEQAMPEGGEITLQAFVEDGANRMVCLSIIDTGNGMDAEVQAKIFQPFFSTKQRRLRPGVADDTADHREPSWHH